MPPALDDEVVKDVAEALLCLRQPAEAQFVEFKRICLANIGRAAEIQRGILNALLRLEPSDTKPLFYLLDYLLCELPLIFDFDGDKQMIDELSHIVGRKMPWTVDHAQPSWGPRDCRKLVDSWRTRNLLCESALDQMSHTVQRVVDQAAAEGRKTSTSPTPAGPATGVPQPQPTVSPPRGKQSDSREPPSAPNFASMVAEAKLPVPAVPVADPDDEMYNPGTEMVAGATDVAKQLDAANEQRKRLERTLNDPEQPQAEVPPPDPHYHSYQPASYSPYPAMGYPYGGYVPSANPYAGYMQPSPPPPPPPVPVAAAAPMVNYEQYRAERAAGTPPPPPPPPQPPAQPSGQEADDDIEFF